MDLSEYNNKFDGTDQSAMEIAYEIASKYSSCKLCGVGKGVGAVVVKNDEIISYGFNGIVDKIVPCTKKTCLRLIRQIESGTRRDECYGDCAEKRAFINAYKNGIDLSNATIYTTKSPCVSCAKLLINIGIKEVVYDQTYSNSDFSFELLKMAKVKFRKLEY